VEHRAREPRPPPPGSPTTRPPTRS
jgi:hypothetical protein